MSDKRLFHTLIHLRGNPRACVYTEPLWGIPYNLYIPFMTVYMYALGVKDVQIGLILSFGMAVQVAASLLGGIVTDKLGRRITTLIFDILSWSVPTLIWAFAQNFWWFLAAYLLNSFWQITNNSWNCLLVEDCEESALVNIYTWVHISGLVSVFFAPISSFFVERNSMVPVVRILFLITFISMTLKFIILFFFTTETSVGRQRMEETRSRSMFTMLKEYKDIVLTIRKTPHTLFLIGFLVLFNIGTIVTTNFFGLYTTRNLGIPEYMLAVFPMVRAALILAIMLLLQDKLNRFSFRTMMLTGLGLYVLANVLLLTAPGENPAYLFIYIFIEAIAYALANPRRDSMLVWFVDRNERARVNSVIYVLMIGFSIPFGWISGYLSSLNRILPFVMNVLLYALCFLMIRQSPVIRDHEHTGKARGIA